LNLLISQRNAIFQAVRDLSLKPIDFVWEEEDEAPSDRFELPPKPYPRLVHKKSGAYVTFYGACIKHVPPRTVFSRAFLATVPRHVWTVNVYPTSSDGVGFVDVFEQHGQAWDSVMEVVSLWLERVRKEDAPDLWMSHGDSSGWGEMDTLSSNQPFTQDETDQIRGTLDELRAYALKTYQLSTEQASFLEERLSFIESEIEGQSKRTWVYTAVGVFFTIATGILSNEDAMDWMQKSGAFITQILAGTRLLQ
jgi:hypothetical protein